MSEPEIGGRQPIPINVEAGKSYWWCACGRSKAQPFCDGSHKGTGFGRRNGRRRTAKKSGSAPASVHRTSRCATAAIRTCEHPLEGRVGAPRAPGWGDAAVRWGNGEKELPRSMSLSPRNSAPAFAQSRPRLKELLWKRFTHD